MKRFKQFTEEFVDMAKPNLSQHTTPFSLFRNPSSKEWREIAKEQEETFDTNHGNSRVTPEISDDNGVPIRAIFYPEHNDLYAWPAEAAAHGYVNSRVLKYPWDKVSLAMTGFVKGSTVTLSPKDDREATVFSGGMVKDLKNKNPDVKFSKKPGTYRSFI